MLRNLLEADELIRRSFSSAIWFFRFPIEARLILVVLVAMRARRKKKKNCRRRYGSVRGTVMSVLVVGRRVRL